MDKAIATCNHERWVEEIESCDHTQDSGKLWGLISTMSGKKTTQSPNQPITFNNKQLIDHNEIANRLCGQFTSAGPRTSDHQARRTKRRLLRDHPLDHTHAPFSTEQVEKAIKQSSNSIATGPDGLMMLHLKHLGPRGLQYLTHLFNLSVQSADIPSIWKQAAIVPIPKPGKPRHLGTSYRPISLLCPSIKVLERLLLPELRDHLPLADSQHGFRQQRSTTSALLPLAQKVAEGFNQKTPPLRTVAMAIDFSKAFDTVNHTKLIDSISQTTLHSNTVRWLSTYLRGRSAFCKYIEATSAHRKVKTGVPQGSVISPLLFNFFVSNYPTNCELHSAYADDVHAAASSAEVGEAADALTVHAAKVGDWAVERDLQISAPKSHVTLFTSHTHQSHDHPSVILNNTPLPLERHPKLLGVTFDTHFSFQPHVKSLVDRAAGKLKILKALAGTNWGQQKETIIMTYKALIWSILSYAAPVWFPNASADACKKLQVIQNTALRIATGCHKRTSAGHLHAETQILPVGESLSLLCTQYLASALRPSHVSHAIVTRDSGPRTIKNTLQSKFLDRVRPHLTDGIIPEDQYKETIRSLHQEAVQEAILKLPNNRVTQQPAPEIDPVEKTFPRIVRTTLSQLRSGFCKHLNDFQTLIGNITDSSCPSCGSGTHNTHHLTPDRALRA